MFDIDTVHTAEITGNSKATMNYINFECDIVARYGIDLVGWTYEKFVNPSEMSTSLPPLQKLYTALEDGSCHFVKLTPTEHKERTEKYNLALEDGQAQPRKKRKDAGKTRGQRARAEDVDADGDAERAPKRRKCATQSSEVPDAHQD